MLESFAYSTLFGWIGVAIFSLLAIAWLWNKATGDDSDDC